MRHFRRAAQITLDLAVLSIAYWLAYLIRFEFQIPDSWLTHVIVGWPYVLVVELAALMIVGVPRFSWRYVSIRETVRIAIATGISSLVLVVVRLGLSGSVDLFLLPFGVLLANCFLGFVGLVGMRATRRVYVEMQSRKQRTGERELTRVLLIGAGQAGVIVARELAARPDLGLQAVGFLDDDVRKHGLEIGGLTVLGTTADLGRIAERKHATRALITIAASGTDIRRIVHLCRDVGLEAKIIPGVHEIVGDRVNLSRIRQVAIEDLLGRAPVQLDDLQIGESIRDAVVMVTGAGGSIGSELSRQVCRFHPKKLLLVERFENALFEIHRELIATFPELTIVPQIADVTDSHRMEHVFAVHRPACVFHAAAHKHVPLMEENPGEAIKNNVGGTKAMADLANRFQVERFVMISTDKAVNPTSVMGATKRVAEIYVQALAQHSATRFLTVRFGNVLGSNGSVIPIFKEQISRGGPIKVTHPDMRRYFMTIPEATQLVLQAGAMGQGGEIFILDMGEPVRIVDLARDLISLSGFRSDEIAIEFTGMRPGEKLFEELSTDGEHADKTKHPKIFIGRIPASVLADAERRLLDLLTLSNTNDGDQIRRALRVVVPEYGGESLLAPAPVVTPPEESTSAQPEFPKVRKDASGAQPVIAAS
ncbi:MAG: polysaccharide biosynthesis protein CapD [Deltaproteobacteria bacterium]|nr:polysaccharide biosynthesis protein CapD [Deltaproteobacteria bacterium]